MKRAFKDYLSVGRYECTPKPSKRPGGLSEARLACFRTDLKNLLAGYPRLLTEAIYYLDFHAENRVISDAKG